MEPKVIFENENFLAVYKPAGILVHKTWDIKHGAQTNRKEINNTLKFAIRYSYTLVDWLLSRFPEIKNVGDDPENRPGIVHRLDKDTSGIMVVPKNQAYFSYLKNLFKEGKVKKTYKALVWGNFGEKSGIIDKPIMLKSGSVKRTVFKGKFSKMEKSAITEYRVLGNFEYGNDKFSLLEVKPKTGRTHQIRVHLASVHHPVVGDQIYGKRKNPFGLENQFLHAESLEWNAEDGSRMKIEAELPENLKKIISDLTK